MKPTETLSYNFQHREIYGTFDSKSRSFVLCGNPELLGSLNFMINPGITFELLINEAGSTNKSTGILAVERDFGKSFIRLEYTLQLRSFARKKLAELAHIDQIVFDIPEKSVIRVGQGFIKHPVPKGPYLTFRQGVIELHSSLEYYENLYPLIREKRIVIFISALEEQAVLAQIDKRGIIAYWQSYHLAKLPPSLFSTDKPKFYLSVYDRDGAAGLATEIIGLSDVVFTRTTNINMLQVLLTITRTHDNAKEKARNN